MILEEGGSGAYKRQYIYLYDQLIATAFTGSAANDELYFYHTDHLNTPRLLTDTNQNVVWQGEYQPFGEVEISTELVENNIRFPGQYFDEETGTYYNYFRTYEPSLGRYVQSDPLGLYDGRILMGMWGEIRLFTQICMDCLDPMV